MLVPSSECCQPTSIKDVNKKGTEKREVLVCVGIGLRAFSSMFCMYASLVWVCVCAVSCCMCESKWIFCLCSSLHFTVEEQ